MDGRSHRSDIRFPNESPLGFRVELPPLFNQQEATPYPRGGSRDTTHSAREREARAAKRNTREGSERRGHWVFKFAPAAREKLIPERQAYLSHESTASAFRNGVRTPVDPKRYYIFPRADK